MELGDLGWAEKGRKDVLTLSRLLLALPFLSKKTWTGS